jgi:predicted deacylase
MSEDFLLKPNHAGWQTVTLDLGPGTTVPLDLYVCSGAEPGQIALVVAGVHGDEYEGPSAIGQVISELTPEFVAGSVWLIPVANPLAFAAGTRTSPGSTFARTPSISCASEGPPWKGKSEKAKGNRRCFSVTFNVTLNFEL